MAYWQIAICNDDYEFVAYLLNLQNFEVENKVMFMTCIENFPPGTISFMLD